MVAGYERRSLHIDTVGRLPAVHAALVLSHVPLSALTSANAVTNIDRSLG
jgi:hypothetical protein